MAPFIKLFGVVIDVYNPTPLRQFRPPNKIRKKRVTKVQEPDPLIPQQLLEKVKSCHEPVFLYQKKLTKSDTEKTLDRLFVIKREEFKKLLTEDESRILNDTGLENIIVVDKQGRLYKLGLTIWPSLKMLVINSGWFKLVNENDAKENDWVQIWGHRDHMGKLCMAIDFKKA